VATTDPGRESIEREMEQTRQRLAQNIDRLIYRASPKTIARRQAAAVKAYFVDPSGSPRTENIVKVAGGLAGVAALFVVIRKIVA
jgi:AmiR/NasT family two-component response regulator